MQIDLDHAWVGCDFKMIDSGIRGRRGAFDDHWELCNFRSLFHCRDHFQILFAERDRGQKYIETTLARFHADRSANNLGGWWRASRELGLPCGSGQVEAQCKTLVGARGKLAGMRDWKDAGAEAVLRLRAAVQDGSYSRLWQQRLNIAA